MKKVLSVLIALSFMIASCSDSGSGDYNHNQSKQNGMHVITVNECQYVLYINNVWAESSSTMVHAGNCTNPIHKPLNTITPTTK